MSGQSATADKKIKNGADEYIPVYTNPDIHIFFKILHFCISNDVSAPIFNFLTKTLHTRHSLRNLKH